jgi:hypothetical protein
MIACSVLIICFCIFSFVDGLLTTEEKLIRSQDIIKNILPSEIALLQFDSRSLDNYWLTSAIWNDYYAKKHGHQFLYYSLTKGYIYAIYYLCFLFTMSSSTSFASFLKFQKNVSILTTLEKKSSWQARGAKLEP